MRALCNNALGHIRERDLLYLAMAITLLASSTSTCKKRPTIVDAHLPVGYLFYNTSLLQEKYGTARCNHCIVAVVV